MEEAGGEAITTGKEAFDLREQAKSIVQRINRMQKEIGELRNQAQIALIKAAILEQGVSKAKDTPKLVKGQMVGSVVA